MELSCTVHTDLYASLVVLVYVFSVYSVRFTMTSGVTGKGVAGKGYQNDVAVENHW